MSSYIPPHMRNKQAASKVSEKKAPTVDDFPTLGSVPTRSNARPMPARSFALLASEWKEHEEEEQIRKDAKEERERHEAEMRRRDERNVFVYRNEFDNCDDNYSVPENIQYADEHDSEWTTIEKKPKKELTLEEKIRRDAIREAEEKAAAENDSVWNEMSSNDWDYRDRRSNN